MKRILKVFVLILIIALIAAILYPVVAQRKYSGPGNDPTSIHMQQLASATQLYCEDYDQRFPVATAMPGIRASIHPYAKDAKIYSGVAGKSGVKEFNFNRSATSISEIPIGYEDPIDPQLEVVWFCMTLDKKSEHGFHVFPQGWVTRVPLTEILESLQYQYPRNPKSLAPADYLADQDPLKEQQK